jgi:hypothetical protein
MRATDVSTVLKGIKGPVGLVGASMGGATALTAIAEDIKPAARRHDRKETVVGDPLNLKTYMGPGILI